MIQTFKTSEKEKNIFIKLNNNFSINIEGQIVINQTITILGIGRVYFNF